ncbi:P-loop containing nucleoside triphosphate hydrolase protein [Mycena latifolia]|nr:P-loop containing nucleoside triphosphate hydrolase protein [Mycena latifolia]
MCVSHRDPGLSITKIGSGKTGYLFLSIIIMIAIAKTPSLCPTKKLPSDPAIVVVCPTNSIELQMEENMAKIGVAALTINSDTVASALMRNDDLWMRARAGISMLILGPEQLISEGFRNLLAFEPFYHRVCALGVDEIHLLVFWGLAFRKAFAQIGHMRARFRPEIPIIGLTATLLADIKVENVNRGEFHLIRRSNARYDIQILFRQLYSGIDGKVFPEIAWVLRTCDKTLIFGNTVPLVFRLKSYLNSLLPADSNRDSRIRTHTGLNWPDDKVETLSDIVNDAECQIIIATAGLAQGNDIKVIKTVIQIGEPESIAFMFKSQDVHARASKTPNRMELAAKIVQQTDAENEADAKKSGSSVPSMSRPPAEILTAKCKPAEQDRQFANSTNDPPCPKKKKPASDIPAGQRLTKVMKEASRSKLEEFRLSVWLGASDRDMGLIPVADFLPDTIISQLLDRYAKIKTLSDLVPFISRIAGMEDYHSQLFDVLVDLGGELRKIKKAAAAAKKKK